MKTGILLSDRLTAGLAIVLLASACGPVVRPAPTATATPTSHPTPTEPPSTAIPTPEPVQSDALLPSGIGEFPLDLVPIRGEVLSQLAPFRELTADGLPASISAANLAFYPSYEYELAGHLDDGQLLVWDMSTGAMIYRDQQASADSQAGQHPALAIDPSFQRYLATSASIYAEAGPATASGTVYRRPDDSQTSFLLSAAGGPPGTTDAGVRVLSIAYSPDGHVLASSLSGGQGGFVQTWDVWEQGEGRFIQEIDFDEPVTALQFTPDGSALICAEGSDLVYVDPNSGSELQRRSVGFPILGLALSPSADSLAVWGDQQAVLQSPALRASLEIGSYDQIRRVEFSPDERLAIVADGALLRFWDLSSGAEFASHLGPAKFLDVRTLDNGRVLATIDTQARVFLWGVRGGFELPDTLAHISAGNAASLQWEASLYIPRTETRLSAGPDWLAAGSQEGIYLVDLPTLQLRRLLPVVGRGYSVFGASANGRWLAWVAEDGLVKIWDLEADALAQELRDLGETCCEQLLLTPDGDALVALDGVTVQLWDLTSDREVYTWEDVQQVHLSPDGSRLAFESASSLSVSIWDRNSRQELHVLTGYETAAPFYNTQFSPDWSVMYWGARVGMQFTDVENGELGPEVPFSLGVFSPWSDRIAAVEGGWLMNTVGQVHMIDVRSGETLAVFDHHAEEIVRALAFSPDGRLLATALDETIKIWDALSGVELVTLPKAGGTVYDLTFSPDGRMLISSCAGELTEVWVVPGEAEPAADVITVAKAGSLAPVDSLLLRETATDAVFSPDQRAVAVSTASGAIWYWEVARHVTVAVPQSHSDWVYRLAFAPAGHRLGSVSKDGSLRLYGSTLGSGASASLSGEISALAFFPNGQTLATGGQDGTLRFWDVSLREPILEFPAHSAWVWGLAASPAGDRVATASADRTIKLWEVRAQPNGEPGASFVRSLTGHTETVWGVDFAPDGRTLASASWDGTVRLWDVNSGEQLAVLEGHSDWVYDVAYSPAGGLLASSSADGTIRLWDAATGELLATLEGTGGRIWSVDFSPDGRFLVSAADGGEVTLWGVAE